MLTRWVGCSGGVRTHTAGIAQRLTFFKLARVLRSTLDGPLSALPEPCNAPPASPGVLADPRMLRTLLLAFGRSPPEVLPSADSHETPALNMASRPVAAAAENKKPRDLLAWMQLFAAPPPGEFDQTAVRWEAGEVQFGGKGKVPTRVTVIPAGRVPDFVAGDKCLSWCSRCCYARSCCVRLIVRPSVNLHGADAGDMP